MDGTGDGFDGRIILRESFVLVFVDELALVFNRFDMFEFV
jgi:hypothetical protein